MWINDGLWYRWRQVDRLTWINHNLSCSNVKVEYGLEWGVAFAIVCWYIWLGRNKVAFNDDLTSTSGRASMLKTHFMEVASLLKQNHRGPWSECLVGWDPPPSGFC
ncbi:hypothetical protein SLA2020_124240 [Shorea laevis]